MKQKLVTVGLDIGQKQDPTCFCVLEAVKVVIEKGEGWIIPSGPAAHGQDILPVPDRTQVQYFCRAIERLPLMTPYPMVAIRMAAIVGGLRRYGVSRPRLMVDATGVGQPIVELIADALRGMNVDLVACTFVHGEKFKKAENGKTATLGKAYLVSRLQALLQTRRLKLPKTAEAQALGEELEVYEIKVSQDGADTYGAFKTGTHDDMATALGLACLEDPFAEQGKNAVGSC